LLARQIQGRDTFGRYYEIPECRVCQEGKDDQVRPRYSSADSNQARGCMGKGRGAGGGRNPH